MDKTPGKPNPMMPSGATDPLEEVQGKKKVGKPSDTKVRLRPLPLHRPLSPQPPTLSGPTLSRAPDALSHLTNPTHAAGAKLTYAGIRHPDGPRGDRGRGARLDGGQRGGPAARQHHRAGPGACGGAARDEAERGAKVRSAWARLELKWIDRACWDVVALTGLATRMLGIGTCR